MTGPRVEEVRQRRMQVGEKRREKGEEKESKGILELFNVLTKKMLSFQKR